jgi:hypothetical protein
MSEKRKITVYATQGQQMKTIESNAEFWSDLKSELSREGYNLTSLHATENINRTDLVNDGAKLPEGEFTIFLRPKQTKSGGKFDKLSFKELRAEVRSDEVKTFLSNIVPGKNWTQLSTDTLRKGLEDFYGGSISPKKTQKSTPIKSTAKEVKKATPSKVTKTVGISSSGGITESEKPMSTVDSLIGITNSASDLNTEDKNNIISLLNSIKDKVSGIESEEAKKNRLAKEAADLMRGF